MPAPAGFKTFVAGAVLSATSDVQVYLMDQVCTVWNDASARTSGLGSPAEGQLSYLKDTDSVEVYDGASWTAVGGSFTWTGSTANGLATYGTSTTVVAESTATYDGTTLTLTQSGGGLKMDGLDSADPNCLDDYEEGTWEAGITCQSGTITVDTSAPETGLCRYTKIGREVFLGGAITMSAISSPSGWLRVTGLPFTSTTAGTFEQTDRSFGLATAMDLSGNVDPGTTDFIIYGGNAFGYMATMGTTGPNAWDAGFIDAGSSIAFRGHYTCDT